jgi:hypothetical protein
MIYDKFDSFTMDKVVRMDNAKVMVQMDQHIPSIAFLTFINFIYYKVLFVDFFKVHGINLYRMLGIAKISKTYFLQIDIR